MLFLLLVSSGFLYAAIATATVGQSVTFSVTASGTAPFTYQWYKNGSPVAGATSDTYTISPVSLTDGATYTSSLANSAGSTTSDSAVLTVIAAAVAPSITTQPSAQSVTAGQAASFAVLASGTAPLSYQWKKNGANISGATSSTYSIATSVTGDAGTYSVTVSNSAGSATSTGAALTVSAAVVAPSITSQPSSLTVTAGQSATFSVAASGTATLSYQWKKNGTNIGGATSSSFSIPVTAASDAATYSVSVTNSGGSALSNGATLTVNAAAVAPSITSQPSAKTVTAGQSVSFSVAASGSATLTYQWRQNGNPIAGATSSTYSISGATTADAGSYSVVVSNGAGSVISSTATLIVNVAVIAPSIVTQPSAQSVTAGQSVTFAVVASGSAPLTYQWRRNGVSIAGAVGPSHTISSTALSDAANYSVTVSNSAGSLTSTAVSLSVNAAAIAPSILSQPTSQSVSVGQAASFSVSATGSAPLAYQWQKNGSNISGATTSTYTIPSAALADAANYSVVVANSVGSVSSVSTSLTVNAVLVAPTITSQPSPQSVTVGQSVFFSVTATGSGPLSYQWLKNGTPIAGAVASTYSVVSASVGDTASYSVTVSNSAGSVTSTLAGLSVSVVLVAPSIISQPSGVSLTAGQSASFSVVATGSAPLSYQWRFNGADIPGATASTFGIANTALSDAGAYTVVITNGAGSRASSTATLNVSASVSAPTIVSQPVAQAVTAGQFASFAVVATGTGPFTYQWRKDGVAISGANLSSYTVAAAALADAASYSVVVGNSAGTITSNSASLSVSVGAVAPTITIQPSPLVVTSGNSASFSVQATGSAPLSYQWRKNGVNIPGATSDSIALANTAQSDVALYSVVVSNPAGSTRSIDVNLSVQGVIDSAPVQNPPPPSSSPSSPGVRLVNLSTRSYVGTGSDVLIAGFILSGNAPKTVLIRAWGPALSKFGVSGVLADPVLELHSSTRVIALNDNWGEDAGEKSSVLQAQQITRAFAWDDGSKDAAVLVRLDPGSYTAVIAGKNNATGAALVEVFEVDVDNSSSTLINISTRSLVKTNDNVQIAGFVLSGTKRVIIRASGPALAQYGVPGVLQDPVLEIHSGSDTIATNDNWDPSLRAEFQKMGIDNWAVASKDSAVVMKLDAGGYTAVVSGKNGTEGVALIEVFDAD